MDPDQPGTATPEFVDGGVGLDGEPLSQAARTKVLVRHGRRSKVVRLSSGDPFLFGCAPEEAQACVKNGIPIEIVPGIPTATAVPTYAGIP